jgi:uncharacterized protein (DUF58 family)
MKWYAGAILLLCVALVFQLGLLAYAMYALLAVLTISRFLARAWTENLSATREMSRGTAEIGDTLAVNVTVQHGGILPVPWVLAEDVLPKPAIVQWPPRVRISGSRYLIGSLFGHGRKSINYQLHFDMRGYYQVGPLVLESGDLFGLHRRYRVAAEPHFVLVYPKVIPLVGYDLASRRPIGEIRLSHRLFEDPTRITGVRFYQPGDPLNRVHWRATARTGVLHSKTYEPSSIAGVTILLAFHRSEYATRDEPYVSELAVTTAASLANAVYQLGQQVGLVTNGRDAVDRIRREGWAHDFRSRAVAQQSVSMRETSDRLEPLVVPTRRGAEQFQRILELLARVELTDGLTFPQLVAETSSRLPRDATVVAILPDVPDETAFALANLRRRGYAVSAVLVVFDEERYASCAGRLLSQGISSRRINDEAALAAFCQQQMLLVPA